jgi:hypothetical protein
MHRADDRFAGGDRHPDGVQHELGAQAIGHRPADHLPAERVDHHREVDEALPGAQVGKCRRPTTDWVRRRRSSARPGPARSLLRCCGGRTCPVAGGALLRSHPVASAGPPACGSRRARGRESRRSAGGPRRSAGGRSRRPGRTRWRRRRRSQPVSATVRRRAHWPGRRSPEPCGGGSSARAALPAAGSPRDTCSVGPPGRCLPGLRQVWRSSADGGHVRSADADTVLRAPCDDPDTASVVGSVRMSTRAIGTVCDP